MNIEDGFAAEKSSAAAPGIYGGHGVWYAGVWVADWLMDAELVATKVLIRV